jgi:hypothetical protein
MAALSRIPRKLKSCPRVASPTGRTRRILTAAIAERPIITIWVRNRWEAAEA